MRKILFRGKRIDNGEWVTGSFVMDGTEFLCGKQWAYGFIRVINAETLNPEMIEIDRKTVGQYTGLTDNNGKKIFEGDIVQHDFGTEQIGKQNAVVEYSQRHAGFMIKPLDNWMYCEKADCIVIGNIHDNSELLGGE